MSYKVLFLDDAIDKLSSHIAFLKTKDIVVNQVSNIKEAVEICNQELDSYDMIILDVKIIYENESRAGIILAKKLIEEYGFTKPIVFFTVLAEDNDQNIVDLLKSPNVFHIQKGVTVTKLSDFILDKLQNQEFKRN